MVGMAYEVPRGNICHAIMSGHSKMRDRKSSVELYPWTVGTNFWNFSVDSLLRVDPTFFFHRRPGFSARLRRRHPHVSV